MNELKESLGHIHASEELKSGTIRYIFEERNKRAPKNRNRKYIYSICAVCACLLFIAGIEGYKIYNRPVSYISIDVNPSIELQLNGFNRVVGVSAYNDDGQKILDHVELKNMSYTDAIDKLLRDDIYITYLQNDQELVFTVISDNIKKIFAGIRNCQDFKKYNAMVKVSDKTCMNEAHINQMSFGKYSAYLELSQYDENVTIEDCHSMTMGELCDRIRNCHRYNGTDPEGTRKPEGNGNQDGQGGHHWEHGGHHGGH